MNCSSLGSCQKPLVDRIWYCYKWFVPTFYVLIERLSDEKSLTSKNKLSCIFFKESFILHPRCDLFYIISISSINHYPAYRNPSPWGFRITFLQFHSFFLISIWNDILFYSFHLQLIFAYICDIHPFAFKVHLLLWILFARAFIRFSFFTLWYWNYSKGLLSIFFRPFTAFTLFLSLFVLHFLSIYRAMSNQSFWATQIQFLFDWSYMTKCILPLRLCMQCACKRFWCGRDKRNNKCK